MSKVQVLLIDGDVIKERYDNFILIGLKKEIKRNNVEVLRSYDNVQFGSEFDNLACNVLKDISGEVVSRGGARKQGKKANVNSTNPTGKKEGRDSQ